MKVTKTQLEKIIKEELQSALNEMRPLQKAAYDLERKTAELQRQQRAARRAADDARMRSNVQSRTSGMDQPKRSFLFKLSPEQQEQVKQKAAEVGMDVEKVAEKVYKHLIAKLRQEKPSEMPPTDEMPPIEDPADEETVKNAVDTLDDIISKVQEKYSEDQELLDNLENLKSLIGEESEDTLNEAHGLSKSDLEKLEDFVSMLEEEEIKRILKFITTSNVLVDKTQDVTKMKKDKKDK